MESQVREARLVEGLVLRDMETKSPGNERGSMKIVVTKPATPGWLHVRSTLDQKVNLQLKGILTEEYPDKETRVAFDCGVAVELEAGSVTVAEDAWYVEPQFMLPYVYLEVTAVAIPTSGRLDAWLAII